MRILVAYGTTEGQTRKIAGFVAERLRTHGHEVALYDTARRPRDLHLADFDAAVIAASVHQREHQEAVTNLVRAHLDELRSMPTLFLSVSLAAAFPEGRPDALAYAHRFVADTGWHPTRTVLVAGALRYSEYDYFKEQVIEHVVMRGREIAEPKGDHELTDWDDLSREVETFCDRAEETRAAP